MKFAIDEPCDERLDTMPPMPGGCFCTQCETVVIDLSRVTRAQAEQRMRAAEGEYACVQLRVDRFGEAVFLPPPKRAAHWSRGLVLVAALTAGGCTIDVPVEPIPVVTVRPDPGPPMVPSAAVSPTEELPPSQPVPTSELNPDSATPVRPTAEQRALTAAKHRPPDHTRMAGRMPIHRTPMF